jgi:hypothetical protein
MRSTLRVLFGGMVLFGGLGLLALVWFPDES